MCDPSLEIKRGLMDFTKNHEFFFMVTVREMSFHACSLHVRNFHSWRETNHVEKDK